MFRVHYMTAPGVPHVYCRVFVAPGGKRGPHPAWASIGNLTLRKDEFAVFREQFPAEFIQDEPTEST